MSRFFKNVLFTVIALLLPTVPIKAENSHSIKTLNVSIWSEYKRNQFNDLSGRERTEFLQRIFQDKVQFVKKHGIRRLIVKILNPKEFEFFHPENFDVNRDDNFYYWASLLSQDVELEALFDSDEFALTIPSYSDTCYEYYRSFSEQLKTSRKPFGKYSNLIEKLQWLAHINRAYYEQNHAFLIKGIVIDPQGAGDQSISQCLINAFDQYRSNASKLLPKNIYPGLRLGCLFDIDQKDLALANLAHFPLQIDIKSEKPNSLGLQIPATFPSKSPIFLPPEWREEDGRPLLDTAYIKMYDQRLTPSIYQNLESLPSPLDPNPQGSSSLASNLAKSLKGIPYLKGPGKITSHRGNTSVKGIYTYFRTGHQDTSEGQLVANQSILVMPPYLPTPTRKVISANPENNKELVTTSPLSLTHDVIDAEYYISPLPVVWSTPVISSHIVNHIYYVFSTEFKAEEAEYFGNWNLSNVLSFFLTASMDQGFLKEPIYLLPNKKYAHPANNIVLYDYSTIPNGKPYPECNWHLGNQSY